MTEFNVAEISNTVPSMQNMVSNTDCVAANKDINSVISISH